MEQRPESGRELTPKSLFGVATEHLGMMLTVGYLAVTIVGMVCSWALYARFGVNVFHFAQIGDFLLAATAWPLASLSVALALVAIAIIIRIDRWADRYRWYRLLYGDSEWMRAVFRSKPMLAAYAVLYVWLAAVMHANWYESRLRSGDGARVRVELQSGSYLGRAGTTPFETQLIGATTAYVFLYDQGAGQVTVVPVENLASLSPPVRGPE